MGKARKPESATRVAIVDDHPVVRAGLAALIRDEPDLQICGEAATPDEAVALAARAHPHVMLVDISLGEASGLDIIRRLAGSGLEFVVVSVHDDPTWVERTIAAGALGYVHKSDAAQDVVRAIRRARSGRAWISSSISAALSKRDGGARVTGSSASPIDALSDREIEVFERIGRGLSTRQIAAALGVSPKTVQTYREHIKTKLGCATSAELAVRAARWAEPQR